MSRLAPFVDAACSVDPTNWGNTYLSYYTFGAAIALGLDLELRDRTDGKVTLDDYMKALWTKYGRTPSAPGVVATPYTAADLQTTLAEVSGSVSFAREFFERYVDGPELVEYGMLLKRHGADLEAALPGPRLDGRPADDGAAPTARASPPPRRWARRPTTPASAKATCWSSIGGKDVRTGGDVAAIVEAAKPGDRLEATYLRHGKPRQATIALRAPSDADAGDARERRRDADARGADDARGLARLAREVDWTGQEFKRGQRSIRSVQRWRARHHHHDHGPRAEGAARRPTWHALQPLRAGLPQPTS